MIFVIVLSVILNLFFFYQSLQEKSRKKDDLTNATRLITSYISSASDRLMLIDNEDDANKQNLMTGALSDIAQSVGWIEAYASEMPGNLVSWIGGIHIGLMNYGIDKAGSEEATEDLIHFSNGYEQEIDTRTDPYQMLETMEDVLSSKEYMGDRRIGK